MSTDPAIAIPPLPADFAAHIPAPAWHWLCGFLLQKPWLIEPAAVVQRLCDLGYQPQPDPFSEQIVEPIVQALREARPMSAIRMGDGEANALTWQRYPALGLAADYFGDASMAQQGDRCALNPALRLELRDAMEAAIGQADLIGLPGLWRPRPYGLEEVLTLLTHEPRGVSGQVLGIAWFLHLAEQGQLRHGQLVSAHLYFGVMRYLDRLLGATDQVICLTNRERVVQQLAGRKKGLRVDWVQVGHRPDSPDLRFMEDTLAGLPARLDGVLCLVGSGPWSEIYCTNIKARGGVAVDLGSGFDLLDGKQTRPVHQQISADHWQAP